jgi:hypothetical protein
MARHAPFATAGDGDAKDRIKGRQSRSGRRDAPSFRRVLGLVIQHIRKSSG